MSASTMPTDSPASAMATAMFAVTVDLPTPPLPLLMAIIRGPADCSGCAIAISLALLPESRPAITRAELGRFLRGQFRRHAGAIRRVPGCAEMAAIPAGAEGGNLAPHGERGHQSGQCAEKPVTLYRAQPVDHADQVAKRILREHRPPIVGQVETHAAPVAFGAGPRDQTAALQRLDDLGRGAPGRRLEAGEARGGPRTAIRAGEEPQAGPLRARQLGAHIPAPRRTADMDEQFRDPVRCLRFVDHAKLIANRNHFDNRSIAGLVSLRHQ